MRLVVDWIKNNITIVSPFAVAVFCAVYGDLVLSVMAVWVINDTASRVLIRDPLICQSDALEIQPQ